MKVEMKGKKTALLTVKCGQVDTPTANGRVYPREVMEKAIAKYQTLIDKKQAVGVIVDPSDTPSTRIELKDVSHLVTAMRIEDNGDVVMEAQTMRTENGKKLAVMLQTIPVMEQFGIDSRVRGDIRGLGNLDEEGKVQDGFEIVCTTLYLEAEPAECKPEVEAEPEPPENIQCESCKLFYSKPTGSCKYSDPPIYEYKCSDCGHEQEWIPDRPGIPVGPAREGYVSAPNIPELDLKVETHKITAESRKLKSTWRLATDEEAAEIDEYNRNKPADRPIEVWEGRVDGKPQAKVTVLECHLPVDRIMYHYGLEHWSEEKDEWVGGLIRTIGHFPHPAAARNFGFAYCDLPDEMRKSLEWVCVEQYERIMPVTEEEHGEADPPPEGDEEETVQAGSERGGGGDSGTD